MADEQSANVEESSEAVTGADLFRDYHNKVTAKREAEEELDGATERLRERLKKLHQAGKPILFLGTYAAKIENGIVVEFGDLYGDPSASHLYPDEYVITNPDAHHPNIFINDLLVVSLANDSDYTVEYLVPYEYATILDSQEELEDAQAIFDTLRSGTLPE